jgi:hypothetical protein
MFIPECPPPPTLYLVKAARLHMEDDGQLARTVLASSNVESPPLARENGCPLVLLKISVGWQIISTITVRVSSGFRFYANVFCTLF